MSDADWPVHLTEHLASHSGTTESVAAFTGSKTVRTKTAGFVQQWSSRWNFAHNVQTRSRPLEVSNAMSGLAAKVDILLVYTLALSLASSIVYARLVLSETKISAFSTWREKIPRPLSAVAIKL